MTGDADGGLATKLIFPLFVLLGLLVMVGVPFLISIFILIFLGAIFLLYKNKTEITQKFPSLSTAKIPWTAIGIIVAIALVIIVAVKFWPFGGNGDGGGGDVFQSEDGLQGWEGGMKVRHDWFILPADESASKVFYLDGINVWIKKMVADDEANLVVKIEDLDGYGRTATFHYLIKGDNVSFVEINSRSIGSDFGSAPSVDSDAGEWNCVKAALRTRIISYAVGNGGPINYQSAYFQKPQQRSGGVNYKVTVSNEGTSLLEIGMIEVKPG